MSAQCQSGQPQQYTQPIVGSAVAEVVGRSSDKSNDHTRIRPSVCDVPESGYVGSGDPLGNTAKFASTQSQSQISLRPDDLRGYYANDFQWRLEVFDLLVQQGSINEAGEFLRCGSAYLGVEVCSDDITHSRAIPVSCHKRYCPTCARREAARLVAAHASQIQAIAHEHPNKNYGLRKVELTTDISVYDPDFDAKFDSSVASLNTLFDKVCGAKLPEKSKHRWSQAASNYCTGEGFIATAEIGEHGNKLHFHVVFFGRYLDKYLLSEAWQQLTGYFITYVKRISNTSSDIRETLKYVYKMGKQHTDTSTGEVIDLLPDPRLVARIALVLRGKRRVFLRGCFRGLENDVTEPGADPGETVCRICGSASEFVTLDIWEAFHYGKYVAARWRLDLIPGNKFAKVRPGGPGPPDDAESPEPTGDMTDQMWAAYERKHGNKSGSQQNRN